MIRIVKHIILKIIILSVLLSTSAFTGIAGSLDDYYLQQFGEIPDQSLQKVTLETTSAEEAIPHSGTPLHHALTRDWKLLEQSTQKVLAKQLASPVLANPATYISIAGHFKVHYATTGTDAPPITDANSNGVPDWVETVAATFEDVYASYNTLGYQPAPTKPTGAPYDIYLLNLAPQGYYGLTNSNLFASSASYPNAFTSWMELDNNFTDSIYKPATYTPLQSLQVTAAHEYHHAVQYGYNLYFDVWYAEATSTWMEDELYDSVNQSYSYIPAWFSNSTKSLDMAVGSDAVTSGAGYGRWIFNRYLSEKHGPAIIRDVWEKTGGLTSVGGNDIPMVPVLENLLSSATYGSTLGNEFFGFAKRVYTKDWTTHLSDTSKIHPYSPLASYSSFPTDANSFQVPSVTLPHYSFAYYKFVPSAGAPTDLPITLNGTSGIKGTAFRLTGTTIDEFPFASVNGTTITIPGFSTSTEVVLLVTNATNIDNHNANFSTNGTGLPVIEPVGGSLVNGVCGTSNGGIFTVKPTFNLCSSGTPSGVSGFGPWSWTCTGFNGGNAASCSANIQTYNVSFVAGAGGTLIGTSNQTVNSGASAAAVAAAAFPGYHFVNWTGTGGFVATTANPLTVATVTATLTITANFAVDVVVTNGACGTSNGGTYTAIPTSNLCTSGVASTVTSIGSWNWTCGGVNGGASAGCSANITAPPPIQYTVTPTTGIGYTFIPAAQQTVNIQTTASFEVTPASGYGIVSVSGCSGSLNGSTYTTGAITANCSISATAIARTATSGTSPTISDALKVLQAVVGTTQLTALEQIRYDVAPLGNNGIPVGNGAIDAADIILILRRSIGIGSW